jgi:hypothetical protein
MSLTKQGFAAHLRKELREFADNDITQAVKDKQKALAIKVWQKIMERTPVNTGRARANWNASVNVPDPTTTNATSKSGDRLEALQQALDQLDAMPVGQTLWISNGLLYVKFLEHGHSGQAPEGIVAVTVAEVMNGF